MINANKIKFSVMIIDDSKTMQDLLKNIIEADFRFEVIACASDPYEARDLIKQLNPDVLTLDIMMPKMDGITFLKNLMRLRPMPVVMVSSLTTEKSAIALEALEIGAIDYIPKPSKQELNHLNEFSKKLTDTLMTAVYANVKIKAVQNVLTKPVKFDYILTELEGLRHTVVGIGASTGGVEAIESILSVLPKIFPAILIVLHIRKEFTSSFVQRIKKNYQLEIAEAKEGDLILPGHIYIASSQYHLAIKNTIEGYVADLQDAPSVSGHKPSIDVLFKSIALVSGKSSIGVLLTGMGKDGAEGLKFIRNSGGSTIVQDENSSVVWGMPKAAIDLDAADCIAPLNNIPYEMMRYLDLKR
jgi:two-component system chemotaxis response regulator CheB